MTGRAILRLSPIAVTLVVAACGGGGGTKTVTVTQTVTASTSTAPGPTATSLRVYFLLNGKVQPVLRTVSKTTAVAGAALNALLQGPTQQERQIGLSTQVSSEASWNVDRTGGVLTLHGDVPSGPALAQVVFTLTQFPSSTTVSIGGKQYTRGDLEDFAPAIIVELPLPFQTVTSPLRAAGSADTFEATFQYELTDASGKVLAKHFATATSGSGVRGTFDVTIPFTVSQSGPGTLKVYENSAANGKPIHVVAIPLTLAP
jgi:germination protein M